MGRIIEESQLPHTGPRELFTDRYPESMEWLDGQTWELDVYRELQLADKDVNGFRSTLRYVAKANLGKEIVTKTVYRQEEGNRMRFLLVRAY